MTEAGAAGIGQGGEGPGGGPPELHDIPESMNAGELAAYLRVNRKTVYDEFRRGELPGQRVGRLIRFYRPDVIKWLRGNGSVSRSPRRKR
jgi:excisionase family DNA binding protein